MSEYLLKADNVVKHFPIKGGVFQKQVNSVRAVDGVTLQVKQGETLGLVGESGCGKTTVGRTILRLYEPDSGTILFNDSDISKLKGKELQSLRRDMQMIFQDPYESLNSRHTVGSILEEPFIIHKIGTARERKAKVKELLSVVGLPESAITKFPHEFSGGQRQRIGIARSIALNPQLVICDEPVSALDVSIQSQVINLLLQLQQDLSLTYIFISHDLTVVKHISDRIAVMYLGRIVEMTDADSIYRLPIHPYTKALISAIPHPDPSAGKDRIILQGEVPSPANPPSGCHFHTRCPFAKDICRETYPELKPVDNNPDHIAACHFAKEINS